MGSIANTADGLGQTAFLGAKAGARMGEINPWFIAVTVTLAPAARTAGSVIPDTLNSELPSPMAEIFTALVPVLVNTASWFSDCPAVTVPNFRYVGENINCCAEERAHNGAMTGAGRRPSAR